MDIATWLEIGLALLVILGGQTVLWVKFKTLVEVKVQTLEKRADGHDTCIAAIKVKNSEAITMPQHDKIQADCQRGIYNDFNNLLRSVDELREKVESNDDKLNGISISIAELRSDLKHVGAV